MGSKNCDKISYFFIKGLLFYKNFIQEIISHLVHKMILVGINGIFYIICIIFVCYYASKMLEYDLILHFSYLCKNIFVRKTYIMRNLSFQVEQL